MQRTSVMSLRVVLVLAAAVVATTLAEAQQRRWSPRGKPVVEERPWSPRGRASTQVDGRFRSDGAYVDGKWIDVEYGRPILRGRRNFWGSGPDYGKKMLLGAPVWRLGADQSTRFRTEANLMFGERLLPAGEYSLFAEPREGEWTLIFSTWGVKEDGREIDPDALWGAYGYTPEKDVIRTTMTVDAIGASTDQLTGFVDMSQQGGLFMVWWDDQLATTPFTVAH